MGKRELNMLQYRTDIDIPASPYKIKYGDKIMLLGSCFADNIGSIMVKYWFDVCPNPFGAIYNPLSVAAACKRLMNPKPFNKEDLSLREGLYHNFMLHGKFSDASADDCLSRSNVVLSAAADYFSKATYLIVTFGTAHVYERNGQIVANCHKFPHNQFIDHLLTVDEITKEWFGLLEQLHRYNPNLKIIITVSPIRHLSDGAHINQVSKATLILAAHTLCKHDHEAKTYFPAYELMMDELRDYRFYADDMIHPSQVAVNHIWERFCENYTTEQTKEIMKEIAAVNKALEHRPFNPNGEPHKRFQAQTLSKIEQLKTKYPYLCVPKIPQQES